MSAFLQKNRKLVMLALLGILGLVLVFGVAQLMGIPPKALVAHGIRVLQFVFDKVAQAGPLVFFAAMALFPVFGVPMLTFLLTAGPLFSKTLGLPMVAFLCVSMVTVNLLISYTLGRWTLRPLLIRMIQWMGYKMPDMEGSDATDLLIILRVTPGVPFFVQNYMAGISGVPLFRYLWISALIVWPFNITCVFFGDALLHGQGRLVMIIVGVMAAIIAGTHMLRHHYAKKKAAA